MNQEPIGIHSTGRRRLATQGNLSPDGLREGQQQMEAYLKKSIYENDILQETTLNGMMKMESVGCSFAEGKMTMAYPVQPWQANRAGFMHGGAIGTAMDISMGICARFYAGESYAPTLELDMRYLRPVKIGDCLVVTCYVEAAGKSVIHIRGEARSEKSKKPVATATAFFMATDNRK